MIISNKMLLIGATEKHSGKTTLSTIIINSFVNKYPGRSIFGVKATVFRDGENQNPDGFSVTEETGENKGKDTARLLSAGAERVYWLRTDSAHAEEGISKVLKMIPDNALILCESNTIRNYIKPAFFIMLRKMPSTGCKDTAAAVMELADIIVDSTLDNGMVVYTPAITEKLHIKDNKWTAANE